MEGIAMALTTIGITNLRPKKADYHVADGGGLYILVHPRSKNMTPHLPEDFSTKIDWRPFVIMGNTMPPRDPDDEDEEDENEEDDSADDPPVVREPDED
jgi:hypothetical protein